MTSRNSRTKNAFSIEVERDRFRKYAETHGRFNGGTYTTDLAIDHRTNLIFHTFDRTLRGRGSIPEETKGPEKRQLYAVVRRAVVYPLLRSYTQISGSQAEFDRWHKDVVQTLKARCPIQWDHGPILTVGLVQKIINLHCKSLWTLEAVPDCYSRFFHATIDSTTLSHILNQKRVRWTRLDSHGAYMQLQFQIRKIAESRRTYPLALECWNWARNRPAGRIGGRG